MRLFAVVAGRRPKAPRASPRHAVCRAVLEGPTQVRASSASTEVRPGRLSCVVCRCRLRTAPGEGAVRSESSSTTTTANGSGGQGSPPLLNGSWTPASGTCTTAHGQECPCHGMNGAVRCYAVIPHAPQPSAPAPSASPPAAASRDCTASPAHSAPGPPRLPDCTSMSHPGRCPPSAG